MLAKNFRGQISKANHYSMILWDRPSDRILCTGVLAFNLVAIRFRSFMTPLSNRNWLSSSSIDLHARISFPAPGNRVRTRDILPQRWQNPFQSRSDHLVCQSLASFCCFHRSLQSRLLALEMSLPGRHLIDSNDRTDDLTSLQLLLVTLEISLPWSRQTAQAARPAAQSISGSFGWWLSDACFMYVLRPVPRSHSWQWRESQASKPHWRPPNLTELRVPPFETFRNQSVPGPANPVALTGATSPVKTVRANLFYTVISLSRPIQKHMSAHRVLNAT